MTNDERAAVARDVLTPFLAELTEWPEAHAFGERYMQRHYSAPAAPETVTVEMGGKTVTLRRKGMTIQGSADGEPLLYASSEVSNAMFARIAADARRIKELEQRVTDEHAAGVANAQLMLEAKRKLEREIDKCEGMREEIRRRDKAELALDALLVGRANYRDDASVVDNAIAYIKWLGGLVDDRTHSANALLRERDEARRALEEERAKTSQGEGHGIAPDTATPTLGNQGQSAPASPAPIPHGAVVEVSGITYQRTEVGDWSSAHRWISRNSHEANTLDALYRALHPVADAATVERVARAIRDANDDEKSRIRQWDQLPQWLRDDWAISARAALRALGITVNETILSVSGAAQPVGSNTGESSAAAPSPAPMRWWMNGYSGYNLFGAPRWHAHVSEQDADSAADKYDPTFQRVVVIEAVADAATVERVARAIRDANDDEKSRIRQWDQLPQWLRDDWAISARAALRALGITVNETILQEGRVTVTEEHEHGA